MITSKNLRNLLCATLLVGVVGCGRSETSQTEITEDFQALLEKEHAESMAKIDNMVAEDEKPADQ